MRLCLLCRDCASDRVDDARKPHQHAVAGGSGQDAQGGVGVGPPLCWRETDSNPWSLAERPAFGR